MKFRSLLAMLLVLLCIVTPVQADGANLVKNSDFEDALSSWSKDVWDKNSGASEIKTDDIQKHSGGKSICIINNSPNDTRLEQEIKVEKNSLYRLSCWIKTENVGSEKKGANLSISGLMDTTKDIRGTNGKWEYVELYGKTGGKQQSLTLTIGLGGYGSTNTGKAWFDSVSVEKVDKLPAGVSAIHLYRENPPADAKPQTTASGSSSEMAMLFYVLVFFIAVGFLYYFVLVRKKVINPSYEKAVLIALLVLGLLTRLVIAPRIEGFPSDISCFKAWASAAAKDLPGFYNTGMFCDYPPFYIYILFLIGKFAGIQGLGVSYTLLVKLPAIAADIVTAYLLYFFGKKQISKETGLLLSAFYVFNPVVLLDSTLWGQVDSFFTLMIVTALLLVSQDKIALSSAMFAAAVLMKPQGIFFLPILLYELIKRKSIRSFLIAAGSGLVAAAAIILPFSRDPLWIFNLFTKTATGYTSASLNAFNIFSLFGANLKQDSETWFIFSYNTWSNIFVLLVLGFSFLLYMKSKNIQIAFLTALVQVTGIFVLWSRMHERYMFPAVAICLFAFVYLKDKRLLPLAAGLSVTIYLNIHVVLYRMLKFNNPHVPPDDGVLFIVSLANVLLLAYIVKLAVDIVIKRKISALTLNNTSSIKETKSKRR